MLLQKTDYAYPSTKPHTTHKTRRYTPTADWHQNKMSSREALHSLKRTTSLLEKPPYPDKNLNENQLIRHLS
jgi:hypothetical protein